MTLEHEYSFTQESDDDNGSWPMPTQMYPDESLHIQVNGSASLHPQLSLPIYSDQWNSYANCVSPNEATQSQSSPNLMMMNNNNYSPSNSLSPFTMQTSSSLPQLSPTTTTTTTTASDPSLSPLYVSSRLGTPTTPASSQSFMPSPTFMHSPPLMPSPTPSQEDHLLQQESQALTLDVCDILSLICLSTEFIFID